MTIILTFLNGKCPASCQFILNVINKLSGSAFFDSEKCIILKKNSSLRMYFRAVIKRFLQKLM